MFGKGQTGNDSHDEHLMIYFDQIIQSLKENKNCAKSSPNPSINRKVKDRQTNAYTYTKVPLWRLGLAHHKWASQEFLSAHHSKCRYNKKVILGIQK